MEHSANMRHLLFLLTLCFLCPISDGVTQQVYTVTETLLVPDGAQTEGAMCYAKLPREADGQEVSNIMISVPPQRGEGEDLSWTMDALAVSDSLRISYRVKVAPIAFWYLDSLETRQERNYTWPDLAPGEVVSPYVLPPLVREDVNKTELRNLNPADTSLADLDRLIRRLGRRVKLVRSEDNFDYTQPLLEDLYRRLTTPRRKHLLLSLSLQYLGVPHRVVAGKVLSYGEVRENELWVEIPVGGRYYRVYYGDGVDRSEWMPPEEADQFLACSFDWRDYTFEVISAPGAPTVATTLVSGYQNVVMELWEKKDEALARKRYAQAVAYLDSVLVYMPRSVIAVSEIGLVYAQAGRPEDGLKYIEGARNMAATLQDKSMVELQLAKYYSLLRQPEESLRALARAYRYAPLDLSVIYSDPRFDFLSKQRNLEQRLSTYLGDG